MNNTEFAEKLKDIALNYKTLYVMGCFGAPMTAKNKARYIKKAYNKNADRTAMINAASADTFGFDCVCLIKGVLWGWCGRTDYLYGGAIYKANGVPDTSADGMIKKCKDISTNFADIEIGEAVWMPGHIGVYIGDGLAVEASPAWENKVQITACNCNKAGYNRRNWTKHGKLPYISYVTETKTTDNKTEIVYTVKKGDTLSKIAKAYGTTYQKLAQYNGIKKPRLIRIGQKILIPTTKPKEFTPYKVKVTASAGLNIRKGPGTNYSKTGALRKNAVMEIVEESTGKGANLWGKLEIGAGWISLDYTKKV